jgi:hypothetical protein
VQGCQQENEAWGPWRLAHRPLLKLEEKPSVSLGKVVPNQASWFRDVSGFEIDSLSATKNPGWIVLFLHAAFN